MAFSSGNPAVDRYIAEGYETVRGMSSRFAATICGHLIRRQTELGITGHIAEIGTFEGRFFIAMALGLAEGERALGIDTFNWPNDGLLDLFHSHCARLGLARERYAAIKAHSRERLSKRSGSGIWTAITRVTSLRSISISRWPRCIRRASSASTICCIRVT